MAQHSVFVTFRFDFIVVSCNEKNSDFFFFFFFCARRKIRVGWTWTESVFRCCHRPSRTWRSCTRSTWPEISLHWCPSTCSLWLSCGTRTKKKKKKQTKKKKQIQKKKQKKNKKRKNKKRQISWRKKKLSFESNDFFFCFNVLITKEICRKKISVSQKTNKNKPLFFVAFMDAVRKNTLLHQGRFWKRSRVYFNSRKNPQPNSCRKKNKEKSTKIFWPQFCRRSLSFEYNPLGLIPSDHLYLLGHYLVFLQELNISSTGIDTLPKQVTELKALRILSCHDNNLRDLPPVRVKERKNYFQTNTKQQQQQQH